MTERKLDPHEQREAVAQSLKGLGGEVAREAARTLTSLFVEWVKTRPLKRAIERRRRARTR